MPCCALEEAEALPRADLEVVEPVVAGFGISITCR